MRKNPRSGYGVKKRADSRRNRRPFCSVECFEYKNEKQQSEIYCSFVRVLGLLYP